MTNADRVRILLQQLKRAATEKQWKRGLDLCSHLEAAFEDCLIEQEREERDETH